MPAPPHSVPPIARETLVSHPGAAPAVRPEMMLPDVLRRYPFLRSILDRYGLRGCGGPHGPAETLGFFARAHGVDVTRLLTELNQAVADPSRVPSSLPVDASQTDRLADSIYRRFFKAGVVVILTAGAAWGALLLLRIGFGGAFSAISIHDVNAHGHAQIFGWVGLFVMGFAYQAFPRMRHGSLWRPDLANMSFCLMVFGVFARAVGEPLHSYPMFRELAVAAGLAEIAAIGLFIAILLRTFRLSGKPYEPHDAFILASLAFFLLQAVYDLGLLYATLTAPGRTELSFVVGAFQTPLRDLQIHGFAMLMILGVGIRMFPALFGLPAPGRRLVLISLALLLAAILGEAGCFLTMRLTGNRGWAAPLYGSILLLAGTSIVLTRGWGISSRRAEPDRSVKFVRAAVTWLHVSMLLLVLAPVYTGVVLPAADALTASGREAAHLGYSHAYYGSVRHAITVGFISLMILGMAAKVVPTLNGVDIRSLPALWSSFVLVNAGCLMRVGFQIATDFHAWAFPVAGVSGLLEVAGIGIWGVHLWRIMNGWRPDEQRGPAPPNRITADDKVGRVVEWFPNTLPVFLARGLAPLANPIMRKTVAGAVSVRMAAAHHQIDLDELLSELNAAALAPEGAAQGTATTSHLRLPVLNHAPH